MVDALVGVLASTGDPRALLLLRWMSGSTYGVSGTTAMALSIAAALLTALALLSRRWLDLLPLGPSPAAALGVPLTMSRLALFGLAGLLSAVATLGVGPLSFVGLMAPHLAREAGMTRALPQMAGAAIPGRPDVGAGGRSLPDAAAFPAIANQTGALTDVRNIQGHSHRHAG
jgi:iron complex transport system permease protein